MLFKILILGFIATILYCLGSGLVYLVKGNKEDKRVAAALSWRVGLSVALFILLIIGFSYRWIRPHGL